MRAEQYPSNVVEIKPEQVPSVALRRADAEDFAEIKKLHLAALALDPSAFSAQSIDRKVWTDEDWKRFIQSGPMRLGVNQHGELVAMAGMKRKEGDVWQLHSVYVDPVYRKGADEKERRLAERLIAELIDTVRDEEQADRIDLIVNQEKQAAVKLYERLGFVTTEELHDHPSADGRAYEKFAMSKTLSRDEVLPLAA